MSVLKISYFCFGVALSFIPALADTSPKSVSDFVVVDVGYGNLPTPEVLEVGDVERWARMLDASAEQRAFILIQYQQFVTRHNEFLESNATRLLEKTAEFGRFQMGSKSGPEDFAKAATALRLEMSRFCGEFERIENEYIDSFVAVLSEDQADRIYLLRNEASRRQARSFPHFGRWTNVELRLVWESMPQDQFADTDCAELERLLDDYETRVTPLLRRMARVYWAGALEMSVLAARRTAGLVATDEFRNQYALLWNRFGEASRHVREVTEQTVRFASETLPESIAKMFVSYAKLAAFPELYPDGQALDQLISNVESNKELDSEAKEAIASIAENYTQEYSTICKKMEDLCVSMGDLRSRGTPGLQTQSVSQELQPLIQQRTALSERTLAELKRIVGEDLITGLWRQYEGAERPLLLAKAHSAGLGYTRHRPQAAAEGNK